MSDLFPKDMMNEKEEVEEKPVPVIEMNVSDKEELKEPIEKTEEDLDKPFVDEETDVEIKPKPKKKRILTEKQLAALAKAREVSKAKRMKLAEARNAEAEAKKQEKKKKAEDKRKAAAEKKAAQLAEIDAFQIVKDKKYSFTKEELNALLDDTLERHETKRKKRKEEEKRSKQPNVAQPYPYALPHVPVPQPYPIHMHPAQPPPIAEMTGEQIRQARAGREQKKVNDFMNSYFNIN